MNKHILLSLIMVRASILVEQTLPLDSRRQIMQFERNYELLKFNPPADTLWRAVAVPPRTTSITILAGTGSLGVAEDSLYVVSGVGYARYVNIPTNVPVTLPAIGKTKIWIRRTASGTASIANIIYRKM